MSQHHTPPDSVQSQSDNHQAPNIHLPGTFQTPSRHPHILNNPRQLGEKDKAIVDESNGVFINCLHIITPKQYLKLLRQTPDTSHTPSRHPEI